MDVAVNGVLEVVREIAVGETGRQRAGVPHIKQETHLLCRVGKIVDEAHRVKGQINRRTTSPRHINIGDKTVTRAGRLSVVRNRQIAEGLCEDRSIRGVELDAVSTIPIHVGIVRQRQGTARRTTQIQPDAIAICDQTIGGKRTVVKRSLDVGSARRGDKHPIVEVVADRCIHKIERGQAPIANHPENAVAGHATHTIVAERRIGGVDGQQSGIDIEVQSVPVIARDRTTVGQSEVGNRRIDNAVQTVRTAVVKAAVVQARRKNAAVGHVENHAISTGSDSTVVEITVGQVFSELRVIDSGNKSVCPATVSRTVD